MKNKHVVIIGIIVFIWIWSLPLIIVFSFLMSGVLVFLLPLSIFISLLIQKHCSVVTNSPLRSFISTMEISTWFPCNTVQLTKQTVVAVHPHGLLCCGALAGIHFVHGSTTILCVAPILFYIPILGWILHLLGCIPADYTSMLNALQLGHSIIVVPGGVPEIVLLEKGDDRALYSRYGFLKLAAATNTPVMAVFVHGECATFQLIALPANTYRAFLSWLTNIPLILPVVLGYYGTWLPKRTPLTLVSTLMDNVPSRNEYKVQLTAMMKNKYN